jgi:hypothetical protein
MSPIGYTLSAPVHIRRADDFAGLIKARREALGLSQQALADSPGITDIMTLLSGSALWSDCLPNAARN